MVVEAHILSCLVEHERKIVQRNDKEIWRQWITLSQAAGTFEETVDCSIIPNCEASRADAGSNPGDKFHR